MGDVPFGWLELEPYLTQCYLRQGLPLYQVAAWPTQPFGHSAATLQTDDRQTNDRRRQ